jgi:sodium transport system ATP-binding protein
MIEVRGLHKEFGRVVAVEDVSFVAGDGAITGLLGPNGAGKTTTLRVLSTLVRADRGQTLIDGIDAGIDSVRARQRLGLLPDARGLYPRLTAREHIRYFGELQGLGGAELDRRIDELLAQFDMRDIADRRAHGFSHGERVKVALARAVVHRPRNVVLDEPTNGLDVMSTRAVRDWLRGLRAEGCCVLFSSHVMPEVAALCERVVVIARGRVVAVGTPDELRAAAGTETLEDAFVRAIGSEQGLSR